MSKMKSTLDGINRRLHTVGEKISELEKKSVETIHNETLTRAFMIQK